MIEIDKSLRFIKSLKAFSYRIQEEGKMKKLSFSILIVVLGIVFSTSAICAEIAKEGTGEIRIGKSGKVDVLPLAKGHLQMNFDENGAIVNAPPNSPFVDASMRAIGTFYAIEGKFKSTGAIVFTRPNGDQIFGRIIDVAGILGVGPNSGVIELSGGTGECSGIEGRLEIMPPPKMTPSKKGIYQGIGIMGINWKIP